MFNSNVISILTYKKNVRNDENSLHSMRGQDTIDEIEKIAKTETWKDTPWALCDVSWCRKDVRCKDMMTVFLMFASIHESYLKYNHRCNNSLPPCDPKKNKSLILKFWNVQSPHLIVPHSSIRQLHVNVPGWVCHNHSTLAKCRHVKVAQVTLNPLWRNITI